VSPDTVLSDFGLFEGINEVLLSTTSKGGAPNAAPMGVHLHGGRCTLSVYEGAKTLTNLLQVPYCVAHVSHDAMLFVRSALAELGEDEFEWRTFNDIELPVLLGCEAYAAFECTQIAGTKSTTSFELSFLSGKVLSSVPRAHNRGFSVLIEACVLATRYVLFDEPQMLERIVELQRVAKRCGDARLKQAFKLLLELASGEL